MRGVGDEDAEVGGVFIGGDVDLAFEEVAAVEGFPCPWSSRRERHWGRHGDPVGTFRFLTSLVRR